MRGISGRESIDEIAGSEWNKKAKDSVLFDRQSTSGVCFLLNRHHPAHQKVSDAHRHDRCGNQAVSPGPVPQLPLALDRNDDELTQQGDERCLDEHQHRKIAGAHVADFGGNQRRQHPEDEQIAQRMQKPLRHRPGAHGLHHVLPELPDQQQAGHEKHHGHEHMKQLVGLLHQRLEPLIAHHVALLSGSLAHSLTRSLARLAPQLAAGGPVRLGHLVENDVHRVGRTLERVHHGLRDGFNQLFFHLGAAALEKVDTDGGHGVSYGCMTK